MKTRIYITIVALLGTITLSAQDQSQALRFSQNFLQGTARYTAMGGAFSAVGGDFTAASQNPAGLGLFRNSQVTITPSYKIGKSVSNYLGVSSTDNTSNLSISNLGLVSTFNTEKESGISGLVFAFGYNTLNDFNNTSLMRGVQANSADGSSLLDNFAWYANNKNERDLFYEDLAFQTALMPLDTVAGEYWHYLQPYSDIGYDGYGQEQVRVVERQGYLGEYAFSSALNLGYKLYIGATLGIQSVRYNESISHKESDIYNLEPVFDAFKFDEYNSTRGYGFAFKLGMIYRPIQALRIGASFHLPTIYHLTDDKSTDLSTYWDANSGMNNSSENSGLYSKEYTIQTPYRATISTAVLVGQLGLISAEYEYVDYSISDMDSPGYPFIDENIAIANDFGQSHNIKIGAEARLNPIYIRAGAQYYSNPYTDSRNGSDIFVYSGGIGFRSNQTFIDLAASYRTSSDLYTLYMYSPEFEGGGERATIKNEAINLILTLGFKF